MDKAHPGNHRRTITKGNPIISQGPSAAPKPPDITGGTRLDRDYYRGPAPLLAPDLLGKLLCRRTSDTILRFRITETECYYGESDTACHASKGKTERTKVLYGQGGIAYVYLCYGIHNLFNIVTGEAGFPQAVLIRALDGHIGPGRLTKALAIDRRLNGADLTRSADLWLEDDHCRPPIVLSKRIGINYAAPADRDRLWRFTTP